jgi:multisubunit Na+/H+ antiporter MnhC subunit
MDVTMAIFLVSLTYKKIKIIISIEIIKKGTHLSKAIIINVSKMKKSNQNHE